jgi:hypothetical protein
MIWSVWKMMRRLFAASWHKLSGTSVFLELDKRENSAAAFGRGLSLLLPTLLPERRVTTGARMCYASSIVFPIKLRVSLIALSLAAGAFLFTPSLAAQTVESRGRPLHLSIVVDASLSLARGKAGAVNWLCGTVVDTMLETGDRFYLVVSRESDEVLFDGLIEDETQKEALKEKIRALPDPSGLSHAERTLRETIVSQKTSGAGAANAIPVLMLVCGSDIKVDGLLTYSRTENFAHWKAITIGAGIEGAVEAALRRAL